jgi:hypothetical protein
MPPGTLDCRSCYCDDDDDEEEEEEEEEEDDDEGKHSIRSVFRTQKNVPIYYVNEFSVGMVCLNVLDRATLKYRVGGGN